MTRAGQGGQATVELALVLPLVALLLLALVQVGLIVNDQILVVHAAREAAREAAVTAAPGAARRAAEAGSGLRGERLEVEVGERGTPGTQVEARVRYRAATDVPLVGALLPDVTLAARAAMRVEQ